MPEAAAQLDPGSAVQVHAGATSATGNSVGHARGGHRTGSEVGHHDRVGRRQPRDRGARQGLGDRQVGDRLRGHGHGRRVVGQVGVRLIAGGDARRVGDRARLRDARRDRQPRAAGVRERSDRPEARRRVVRALRRGRRLEREPGRQHLRDRDARRRTRALVGHNHVERQQLPDVGRRARERFGHREIGGLGRVERHARAVVGGIRIHFRLLRDGRGIDQGAGRRDRRHDRQRGRGRGPGLAERADASRRAPRRCPATAWPTRTSGPRAAHR